jgi:hypothetical protein
MSQLADAPAPASVLHAADPAHPFRTDHRRWLQLALAAIWVFDGLLQFQTYMFSKAFATDLLAGTAQGNPRWIANSVLWASHLVEANPVLLNAAFAILQLGIGLAIAWRRSLRVGLGVSIVWALVVWWFGEGLGGLLAGGATALMGAPGAVLLYLVLAVLLWPTAKDTASSFTAAQPIGVTVAKIIWVVLWVGLAALNLQPSQLTSGSVHSMESGMGDGQPGWVAFLINGFTRLSAHNGVVLSIIGAVILALIGVGIVLPRSFTRVIVVAALVAAAFIWVVGEALGALFGGQSTDVNSGPLLALIALAYWPTKTETVSTSTGASA